MDSQYKRYFEKKSKYWSLTDFDSWALNNIEHCQKSLTHRVFYRHLNKVLQDQTSSRRKLRVAQRLISSKKDDLKEANDLWRTPDVLRQLSLCENNSNIEEEERTLALEMRKLELRERRAKVRSLELRNIQLENELREQLE
ncbi:hypothetical protein RhiirA4_427861 [Rhizophagus irregularis]|uniref:Uncharacterized protein n=1 Tax=Rhizophagus irregularis TaxID=588596 RepID=A0A2I1HAI5_9GLOM|nr:hypothetical protein RhiirA4_427861 [Rhizophagus irregularis]